MKKRRGDTGATVTEYALIVGLVVVVCLGVISFLGRTSDAKVDTRSDAIGKPVESNALTSPGGGGGGGTTTGGTGGGGGGGPVTAHVSSLTGVASSNPPNWSATVTITVVDDFGSPVQAARVTGSWSSAGGGTSCEPTSSTGTCTITSGSFKRSGNGSVGSLTFTMVSVSGAGLTYDPGSNTSNSIIINAP